MPDPWAEALMGWVPPELPKLEVPEPQSLLYGFDPPDWIVEEILHWASSPSLLCKVAAVGTAARLGAGSTKGPKKALELILAGAVSPAQKAVYWANHLSPEVIREVESTVVDESGRLGDNIESLHELVSDSEGGEIARAAVRAVCVQRDLLESACWVLERSRPGNGSRARRALQAIDELAAAHLTTIDSAGDLADDLLSSVSWQEPDAWWGCRRT